MQKALQESGLSLDELISLMGIELKNCSNLVPEDVTCALRYFDFVKLSILLERPHHQFFQIFFLLFNIKFK